MGVGLERAVEGAADLGEGRRAEGRPLPGEDVVDEDVDQDPGEATELGWEPRSGGAHVLAGVEPAIEGPVLEERVVGVVR